MKKWLNFFCLSFFSDKTSKEGAKRGYTNVFLGLILAFAFLWAGYVGSEMLPFGVHYKSSKDFGATVRAVFANSDVNKRIFVDVHDSTISVKKYGGEYVEDVLVNTFENETDKQNYSVNGYHIVVDSRGADALAEVEAYCVSNDGKGTVISYQDYLTLSEVARLNFDFKLEYTGKELELSCEFVQSCVKYLSDIGGETSQESDKLSGELSEGKITKDEYNRSIYKLYFTNYYPEITEYETSSEVPLLRNYYYHKYIKQGYDKYLFIFDDYMVGSFQAKNGAKYTFYGFYDKVENGTLVSENATQDEAYKSVDSFIKKAYNATASLSLYTYAMNVFSLIPFIALMPMVVTLLAYSILKLKGVESITSLGSAFKIVGSYVWVSAAGAAVLTVISSFFLPPGMLAVMPLLLLFITLAIRSIIFAINETKAHFKTLEQEIAQTEV